ncbi:MAG: hypothetical protein ACJ786_32515 [Catenulispora sp.]
MADNNSATAQPTVRAEDLLPVRSRVSWGALLSGAMVAIAVLVLLSVLGAACELTAYNRSSSRQLETAGAIWAVVSTLIALFVGGYVTSQLAVGENRTEAGIYGIILWGVLFTLLLMLATSGTQLGVSAMWGLHNNPAVSPTPANPAGVAQVPSPRDIDTSHVDRDTVRAAWLSFIGVALSMLASVGGALAGCGPTLVLRRVFSAPVGGAHTTAVRP